MMAPASATAAGGALKYSRFPVLRHFKRLSRLCNVCMEYQPLNMPTLQNLLASELCLRREQLVLARDDDGSCLCFCSWTRCEVQLLSSPTPLQAIVQALQVCIQHQPTIQRWAPLKISVLGRRLFDS